LAIARSDAVRAPAFSLDAIRRHAQEAHGIALSDIDDLLEIARREAGRSLTDEECRQYLRVDECSQA
jgi:hypothetical protein